MRKTQYRLAVSYQRKSKAPVPLRYVIFQNAKMENGRYGWPGFRSGQYLFIVDVARILRWLMIGWSLQNLPAFLAL
jgi:hypothetical protein